MKHNGKVVFSLILFVTMVWWLTGCSSTQDIRPSTAVLKESWTQIEKKARGQTVYLYMWGGSASVNRYIDEWVAPRLKQEAGVILKRVPISDTKDIINKLMTEKQAGKQPGSADVIWINGENFAAAKDNGLLLGPIANRLPNVQRYVNLNAPDIRLDFAKPTDGYEVPWGKAQFVFIYDSKRVKNPPKSMAELKQWVREHPGKFTYPAPPDFTGSAFIRQVLYETTGGYQPYLKHMSESELEQKAQPLWQYLNDIKPYLWRRGTTYPESVAKLDLLNANGEVWMSMGYDAARASNLIATGQFPPSTRTFVLNKGTLSNTHYLSIPFNAPHPEGAMVTINFLLSPQAQWAKADPAYWGDEPVLDPAKLSSQERAQLNRIPRGEATLPEEVLAAHRVPEVPASVVNQLEKGWKEHVAKK